MAAMISDDMDELLQPQPSRTFSIHAPDSLWIVRSGRLDLFVVRTTDGELAGARHHLLSIEPGKAAFGMCAPERKEIAVVASVIPGTELLCLPQACFRGLVGPVGPGIDDDAITLLEEWIFLLGSVCSGATRAKVFTELSAGTILEATDQPKPVMPVKGILWVEHLQGTSLFLNIPEIAPICGGSYFPLSRDGWLQPNPQSPILSADSEQWVKADSEWQTLQAFHKTILRCLSFDHRLLQDKERKRLLRQGDSDAVILRGALRTLASPLLEEEACAPLHDTGVTDPIFLACEAAGESLGIRMIPPPEMHRGLKLKEPLAAIARASALRYRVVALKGKWWTDATGPLVAFRDTDNHPLALLPSSSKGFKLYDPVAQKTIQVNAAVALTLNGFAYAFYRPLPNQKLSVRNLLAFGLQHCKRELLTIVLMGIGGGLLGVVFPIATGIIFDSVIPS